MDWSRLVHLGDLSLTMPAGAAVAAWLLAAKARRAAFGWSLVFGLALALVAASKIAFLGWATRLPAFDFRAASGHAAGFTSVFPVFSVLALRSRDATLRRFAVAASLGLAGMLAALLVHTQQHTAAEALAGWLIGAGAAVCAIRLAGDVPPPPVRTALPLCALAWFATAWLVRQAPLGWWLVKLALVLSGNPRPTPWGHSG